MLDIHPPEHAAHTWRDFFIHIATIVVGLLIAIGLEQSVEALHHRHELRETRDALERERLENIHTFGLNTQGLRNNVAVLRNNLLVMTYVKEHPHATRAELPGILQWSNYSQTMNELAWHTAQTSNIVQLMPREESTHYSGLYDMLNALNTCESESWNATTQAQMFTFIDPDPTHLSAADVDHEIKLLGDALIAKYRLANQMDGLHRSDPGFAPSPTDEDFRKLFLGDSKRQSDIPSLAAARAQTSQRLAATPQPAF
jgi:hypothetical protein